MQLNLAGVVLGLSCLLSSVTAFAQVCPGNAPLDCGTGCCPYGDGGRTDVCCPGNLCTRNGSCGGNGGGTTSGGGVCPSSAPLACGEGCCPYGDGGRTDVCCPGNLCTRNGSCGGGGSGDFGSDVVISDDGDEVCVVISAGACILESCGDGTDCSLRINGQFACGFPCNNTSGFESCNRQAALDLEAAGRTGQCGGGGSTTTMNNAPPATSCPNPCGNNGLCCRTDQTCGIGIESGVAGCYDRRPGSSSCPNPCGNNGLCCRTDQTCGIGIESGVAGCYDRRPGSSSAPASDDEPGGCAFSAASRNSGVSLLAALLCSSMLGARRRRS